MLFFYYLLMALNNVITNACKLNIVITVNQKLKLLQIKYYKNCKLNIVMSVKIVY